MPHSNRLIAFVLFSAFALCANLASALHEFGHVLGCWLGGGRVGQVVLRPFDFSYVDSDMGNSPPWSHMLLHGGGILFGVVLALPCWPLARLLPRGSAGWLILFMTVTLAFGLNGTLLLQSVATGAGDPAGLLIYGQIGYRIPPAVMRILFALLAIPLLAVFGYLMRNLLLALGPAPDDSLARWVTTVEAGFLPYFLLMTGHTAWFGNRETLFRQMLLFYVPFMLLFALLILAAATWTYRTAGDARQPPAVAAHLTGGRASLLFVLACVAIGCELAFLGPR